MGLSVNCQMAKKSKTEYFYRQPSNERAKISRQIPSLIFKQFFNEFHFFLNVNFFLNFLKKFLHNFLYFFQVFLIFVQTIFC